MATLRTSSTVVAALAVALACVTFVPTSVSSLDQYDGARGSPSRPQHHHHDHHDRQERPKRHWRNVDGVDDDADSSKTVDDERNDDARTKRTSRSYYYNIQTPSSFVAVWKPPVYRIERPYYIPVFGSGRFPVFLPPQPLYINPGYPEKNPPKSTNEYLPPESPTPDVFNRFDGPVWDSYPTATSRPSAKDVPTRRPFRPTTTPPPLVHNEITETPVNSIVDEIFDRDGTPAPPSSQGGQSTPKPSQCIWAIINCCKTGSMNVNENCFERFACPGPFWDRSPCDSDFARIAIETALNYYE